ncbi:MAG: PIN domain-containing protein [Syntrophobacteraceae bacterium]|jgi:predicted nucleic acid-binding protein
MKHRVILDTGPLVAFLNGRDKHHDWAEAQWAQIQPPLLTCEAVISEACFLLREYDKGAGSVFELLQRKVLWISFCLADQIIPVSALLKKYGNLPISVADACLVRLAELHDSSSIMTLDAHFQIYRKNKRRIIPLLAPPHMS